MQVLAATRFVVPALEIIDSRIEGWKIKLCDTIADNASSARIVLGNSAKRVDQFDLKLVGMVLEKNGDIVQTGAGGAVLGHPAVAVAWLANAIGQFGVSLGAGDIVMPGALCGPPTCAPVIYFKRRLMDSVRYLCASFRNRILTRHAPLEPIAQSAIAKPWD